MITLALFQHMAEQKVAGLVADENFFYDEMPMQRDGKPASGVWVITRSGTTGNSSRPLNVRSIADFYIAMSNKATAAAIHAQIMDWVTKTKYICDLSGSVGGVAYHFANVRMRVTATPANVGITENGFLVKMISVQLIYDIN